MNPRTSIASVAILIIAAVVMIAPQGQPPTSWLPPPTTQPIAGDWRTINAELLRLEVELERLQAERCLIADAISHIKARGRPPAPENWARVDRAMAEMIRMRDELNMIVRPISVGGDGPRRNLAKEREMEQVLRSIADYAAQLDEHYVIVWEADGARGRLAAKDLTTLDNAIGRLDQTVQQLGATVRSRLRTTRS